MQGISTGDTYVIGFGAALDEPQLVTAANSSQSLGATDPGSVKITPLSAYPRKGRATQGVRCHRFLKNEDQLYFAGVSTEPKLLNFEGVEIAQVEPNPKRDASGESLDQYLAAVS